MKWVAVMSTSPATSPSRSAVRWVPSRSPPIVPAALKLKAQIHTSPVTVESGPRTAVITAATTSRPTDPLTSNREPVARIEPPTCPETVTEGVTAVTLPRTSPVITTSSAAKAIRSPSTIPSITTRRPAAYRSSSTVSPSETITRSDVAVSAAWACASQSEDDRGDHGPQSQVSRGEGHQLRGRGATPGRSPRAM